LAIIACACAGVIFGTAAFAVSIISLTLIAILVALSFDQQWDLIWPNVTDPNVSPADVLRSAT
jgi:hypothetical protein